MLKSVNSAYNPFLVALPNIKIPIKLGSNVILYKDLYPDNLSNLANCPILILTYRKDKRIILKTFKQFPLSIKERGKNDVRCYMNDSLIIIEDMSSVVLLPLIKDSNSQISFECLKEEYYSFEEEENNLDFLDNLIKYFDKEKKKLIKEKEDLNAYLKYINDSNPKKLLSKKRKRSLTNEKPFVKPAKKEKLSLPLKKCSICLELLNDTCYLNTCKHEFCSECINTWAKLSSNCPLCKKSFDQIVSFTPLKHKAILKKVKQQKFTPDEEPVEEWYDQCDEACLICNKGDQNHLLLVCDKCNKHIAHTYCVGLDVIPEGEWYCPICRDKSNTSSLISKRKKTSNKYKRIKKKIWLKGNK